MYLHARTFCTIADRTFIPMGVMYFDSRMFCTLTLTARGIVGRVTD